MLIFYQRMQYGLKALGVCKQAVARLGVCITKHNQLSSIAIQRYYDIYGVSRYKLFDEID